MLLYRIIYRRIYTCIIGIGYICTIIVLALFNLVHGIFFSSRIIWVAFDIFLSICHNTHTFITARR